MNNQVVTTGIVLTRTDFGEADRIITVLTPDNGKVKAIAKAVRKPKSKLAGGIELFSVSNLTFLPGRGDLQTLISSRILTHYGNIVKDIKRTMLGYEFLKRMNRLTEDGADPEYFDLLQKSLDGLNNSDLPIEMLELWFDMQLLKVSGHAPNLQTDTKDKKLADGQSYIFSFDDMAFVSTADGPHGSNLVKLLRLSYGAKEPGTLAKVKGAEKMLPASLQLTKTMLARFVRV